jgi:O-antigen ligase
MKITISNIILPKKKDKSVIFLFIIIFLWFVSLSFLQNLSKNNNIINYIILIPSLIMFFVIFILNYQKYLFNALLYNPSFVNTPLLFLIVFFLVALFSIINSSQTIETLITGIGYWGGYLIAVTNMILLHNFLLSFKTRSLEYENLIAVTAFIASSIILIFVLLSAASQGMLQPGQRLEATVLTALRAGGVGLISLLAIIYCLTFGFSVVRLIISIIAIYLLFITGSRSAIIAVFLSSFIICLFKNWRLSLLFLFIAILIYFFNDTISKYVLDNVLALHDKDRGIDSLSYRRDLWRHVWELFLKNPLLGIGFRMSDSILTEYAGSTHNYYLMILLETGIIGMIPLMLAIIISLWRLFLDSMRYKDKLSIFYLGILSGSLIFATGERILINIGNVTSLLALNSIIYSGLLNNKKN